MGRVSTMTDQTSDNAKAINEAINILYDVRDFLRTQRVISRTGSDPMHARDFAEGDLLQRTLESDGWHGYLDEGHIWRQV